MNRCAKVHETVRNFTIRAINDYQIDDNGIDALNISLDLKLDRANVSRDLNILWKSGSLIKINDRPVLFMDRDELLRSYALSFLPNTIVKGDKLSNYIQTQTINSYKTDEPADNIDRIIGAKDSLSLQIQKAKAAISYPPNGLHMLIVGSTGVGKWKFADNVYHYALAHGRKKNNSKFIRIDCQYYSDPVSNFNMVLCGAAKGATATTVDKYKKGLIEECNGGVLYLDNIHRLHTNFFELIIELIEKNLYFRVGEAIPRELNCTLIASTTLDPQDTRLDYVAKYLPVKIIIPNLDDRNLNEKIEQILFYFSLEAMQTKFPIRMHKDILALFVLKQYKENLTELHNEVRQVCSKAFLDACNSSLNILAIGFQHLSVEMSSLTNDSPLKLTISRILSALPNDYLLIDEKGNSSAIDYFRDASKDYGLARINNFICEFNTDIETIDNIQDYVTENLSILTNCGNTQLNALKNSINPITYQLFLKAITDKTTLNNFNQYPTLFYGSLIHVSNLIKRIENYSYSTGSGNDQPYTKNIYANEYQDAEGIIRSIENLYHCQISSREIDFITLYFAIANQCANKSAPSIILLSHGPDIAKTMEIFIKKEFPSEVKIIGIDYQPEMQFNDLLEITAIRAHELDNGAGILIIADFEPLLSVSDYLRINENIKSRTLSPLSLTLIQDTISKIAQGLTLDQIAQVHDKKTETKTPADDTITFIDKLTANFINKTLTFIDPNKAVSHLSTALNSICENLNLLQTDNITVKFLCHSVHMLERVIRKEPLIYPKLNSFINQNQKTFQVIEKSFNTIEEVFGIKISSDELAYITEIFIN